MAYYFAVKTKENEYNGLNVRKSGFFNRKPNETNDSICLLEEIDDYTTKFLDEKRIKECLISEKILDRKNEENPLAIIDASIPGQETVVDGILFKEVRQYLQNPLLAIEYIERLINDYNREDLIDMIKDIKEDITKLDYKKLREIILFISCYEKKLEENRGISRRLEK